MAAFAFYCSWSCCGRHSRHWISPLWNNMCFKGVFILLMKWFFIFCIDIFHYKAPLLGGALYCLTGPGSNPSWDLPVEFACSPCASVGFSPLQLPMQCKLVPLSVHLSESGVLQQTGDQFRINPASTQLDRLQQPPDSKKDSVGSEDGWTFSCFLLKPVKSWLWSIL